MNADKQEIERIINEIICNGNYSRNIGGFVSRIKGGRFTPPSWPKFDENWMINQFYIGALKTEHLHEWLEHLFSLKLGEPEPDMFCVGWGPPEKSEEEIAQQVFDLHYDCELVIVEVQRAKMLKTRKMEVARYKNGDLKSWKWVE